MQEPVPTQYPRVLVCHPLPLFREGAKVVLGGEFDVLAAGIELCTPAALARWRPRVVITGGTTARWIQELLDQAPARCPMITVGEPALPGTRNVPESIRPEQLRQEVRALTGSAVASRRLRRLLTSRQTQVLSLIAEGHSNKEISARLGISVKTVEFHRGLLMNRLGAHSAVELTRIALLPELRALAETRVTT